jgi:hypothetical protein
VTDEQRGYRQERPLADIIPPDRRRLRAAALVAGGMIAGAALFGFVQHVTTPVPPAIAPYESEAEIRSFSVGIATADITSPRPGPIASDGKPDQSFDLVVDGAVESIAITSVDSAGRTYGMSRWATSGDEPRWQLAVFEDANPVNRAEGTLAPLAAGRHRLRLYASDNGSFEPGSYFRASITQPGGRVTKSVPLAFTGHGPAHVPAHVPAREEKPPIPPSEQGAASPAFNRAAAAAALGTIDVRHCRSLSGADGSGHVQVVFANDGTVSHAEIDDGPNMKPPRGECITNTFRATRVPPFAGAPVRVGKTFSIGRETTR